MAHFYEEDEEGRVFVTTSTGWKVECMPVGDLLLQVGNALTEPDEPQPPTYEIEDVTGDKQERAHDEESIKDPKTTEKEKEAWDRYIADHAAYELAFQKVTQQRNDQKARFIALRGVRLVDPIPDLEEWAEEQRELFGLDIPTGKRDRLLSFLHTEVVRTESDGIKISAGIFRATGLDEEVMDQIEATFLRQMGRTEGTDAGADQGEAEAEESKA